MNKFFFLLMALATMTFISCGDDNDDVNPGTDAKGNITVTYTVNTQPLYDTFDITSDMATFLKAGQIKVATFVYNASGSLVAMKKSFVKDFDAFDQSIDGLAKGNYTFVTVETAYNGSNTAHTPWIIADSLKLSTLAIVPTADEIDITYAIGVSSQTVNVTGNQVVTATPAAVGSKVNVKIEGFENSTFVNEGFATRNYVESYSLDPSVAAEKRCTYGANDSLIFCMRGRVSTTESVTDTMSLYILDHDISCVLCFQEQADVADGAWYCYFFGEKTLTDGKTYWLGMKYIDEYTYPSIYFGEQSGFYDWLSGVVKFTEPCLLWGTTVSNVHKFMDGYTQWVGTSTTAEAFGDIYYTQYAGNGTESSFMYMFTNSTKGLFGTCAYYDADKIGEDIILTYLNEKYNFVQEDSGVYRFLTADKKTEIELGEYDSMWLLVYGVASQSVSASKANRFDAVARATAFEVNMRKVRSPNKKRLAVRR